MKILGGDLEPSHGNVSLEPGLRLGKLKQDQFAYEDRTVIDVVLMGHIELWNAKEERDAIYANLEATEEDYMRAADLEVKFGEYGGCDAEARAGALLLGVGIPESLHFSVMAEVAPATNYGYYWHKLCLLILMSCCSTNRPTIWILIPFVG